jgi:hypothetical protein
LQSAALHGPDGQIFQKRDFGGDSAHQIVIFCSTRPRT